MRYMVLSVRLPLNEAKDEVYFCSMSILLCNLICATEEKCYCVKITEFRVPSTYGILISTRVKL